MLSPRSAASHCWTPYDPPPPRSHATHPYPILRAQSLPELDASVHRAPLYVYSAARSEICFSCLQHLRVETLLFKNVADMEVSASHLLR